MAKQDKANMPYSRKCLQNNVLLNKTRKSKSTWTIRYPCNLQINLKKKMLQ